MVLSILAAAAVIVVISIVASFLSKRREGRFLRQRREELRRQQGYLAMQQQELERMTRRILATSSTASIAGFEVLRQIEAVFTDGHPSPNRAIDVLKAMAAELGANAIINLSSERLPSGKCLARGDAVLVQPHPLVRETPPAADQ
ncbi:MAG: hypothetical protein HZB38_16425 [Planctomycetes bacterium]|nr:hypothetical protein [Planctomycetota bacterium]